MQLRQQTLLRTVLMSVSWLSLTLQAVEPVNWNEALMSANKQAGMEQPVVFYAIQNMQTFADKALRLPVLSVVHKSPLPASQNPHDYLSVGPYWWPDPNKVDGLPWIRKDGQVNPSFRGNNADNVLFKSLVKRVQALAFSYYYSDKPIYAEQAVKLLKTWFIAPETRMNPNLNYAQSIPGRTDGRGIGIIDFRSLVYLLDVLPLLKNQISAQDQQALEQWLTDFYGWLKNSKNGQEEAAMHNNHGSFYDLILTSVAWYLGDYPTIKQTAQQTKQRILQQIKADGTQPHELARTRPFHYSTFNLKALFGVARIAARVDVDLWHVGPQAQPRLLKAYQYLIDNMHNDKLWQGSQEGEPEWRELASLAYQAQLSYQNNDYFSQLSRLPIDAQQQLQQCTLIFNAPVKLVTFKQTTDAFCDY